MKGRIIIAFVLSLAMLLSLSACGNSTNGTTTTATDESATTTATEENATTTASEASETTTVPSSNEPVVVTPAVEVSVSDTSKTCLLDKFHNILFGTIDTEEICMDFYLDGNNITAFYIGKDSENEIKLVGNLNGFKITLKDESQNTLTGTVTSANEIGKFQGILTQSNGNILPVTLDMSYACGGSLDNFYEIMGSNNQEVETFVSELKNNIISANKQAVAQVIDYPISIYIGEDATIINSVQEFIDNYDKIMNENFFNIISDAYTNLLFNNYQGAMFGGDFKNIWIQKKEDSLIITGINN